MKTIIVFLTVVVAIMTSDLPSGFKYCDKNDPHINKCLSEAIAKAVSIIAKGNRALKILPIDPIEVDYVIIKDNGGAVTLTQEYWNLKIHGVSKNLKVSVKNFNKDTFSFDIETFSPQLDVISNYKMNGKILLLPIRGEGKSRIKMSNFTMILNVKCEIYEKNGENYLRLKKVDTHIKKIDIEVHLDNLFDGNPELGEEMNKFLNENIQEIFSELKVAYENVFRDVIFKIGNSIVEDVPLKKLFPFE